MTKAEEQAILRDQLASTIREWGPESKGYSLRINPPAPIRPSLFVIDIETDAGTPAKFVGMCMIDVRGNDKEISYYTDLEPLKPILSRSMFIGHNVKADLHWLQDWGMKITGSQIYGDTMIMAYCADSTEESYGLKILAKRALGWEYPSYRDLVGQGSKKLTLDLQETELVAAYCGMDTASTSELFKCLPNYPRGSDNLLQRRVSSEAGEATWRAYYNNIELPVYRALFDMESTGASLDVPYLSNLRDELTAVKAQKLETVKTLVGESFNPGSPKQIQDTLFPKLGIKEPKTDVRTLEQYAHLPEIQAVLEFRSVSKLLGTYVEAFLALPSLPRVHARFNQVAVDAGEGTKGIRTGRLSSSDPNLQNIPSRTPAGKRIREAFVAPAKHKLVCADYSQVEYRLLAHLSGETKLVNAFLAGADVHEETGKALGVDRALGKTLNFAAIYGAQPKRIAATAKIGEDEATLFLERYWRNLPGVRNWISYVKTKAAAQRGVTTMFGRFIPLVGLDSRDKFERFHAERSAVNYIIQGSAAEIMKLALLRFAKMGKLPTMTVHDEFVFEVPEQEAEKFAQHVMHTMSTVVRLTVPLVVDAHVGKNWREAKG